MIIYVAAYTFVFFFVGAVLQDSIFEESANEVTLFGDCKQWSVLEWYNLDNCVWFCGDVTFLWIFLVTKIFCSDQNYLFLALHLMATYKLLWTDE